MPSQNLENSATEAVAGFRHFRSNGGGHSIHVDPGALDSLELQVREGVKAIRGHGVETGGLVLGHPLDWDAGQIVITGFTCVEIEHRFGPSFRPSEADLESFREAAAQAGDRAIGYFRSQLRSGMLVRDEDLAVLASLFPDRDCCFAPIEATLDTPSIVSLHKVRPGSAPLLAVRFPLKEIKTAGSVAAKEHLPEPIRFPSAQPAPLPSFLAAASAVPQERSKAVFWILGTGAALVIATGSYLAGRQFAPAVIQPPRQSSQTRQSSPGIPAIDLRMLDANPVVKVYWDSTNPLVQSATRGLLVLFDGPEPRRVELDEKQTRSGLYSFKPLGNKITAWITIYQPNGSFAGETKELIRTAAAPVTAPKGQIVPRSQPPLAPKSRNNAPAVLNEPTPVNSWTPTAQPVAAPEPVRVPIAFEPPPQKALPVPAPQLPAISIPAPPDPALKYGGAVNRSVAAQIIHQAKPSVPAVLASRVRTEVQLEVGVLIDATGKVTGARVISSRGALAGLLAIEALKAAQLCRFSPAQENGRPVPSNMTLTFRFAPKPN